MIVYEGQYTTAKVMIDEIEEKCAGQIVQIINHPAFTNLVAVMPDCHYGKGAVIGFTMLMTDKMIPNIVGSDINCGILMLIFGKMPKIDRKEVDKRIRDAIPFGKEVKDRPVYNMEKNFPWQKTSLLNIKFCRAFNEKFKAKMKPTFYDYKWFEEKCNQIGMNVKRAVNSIGTLGGGK